MIDYPLTLAPASQLAEEAFLLAPDDRRPLWSLGVRLAEIPGYKEVPPSARLAGAMGHTRADTFMRGTGEAVERYALRPCLEPSGAVVGPASAVPGAVPVWNDALAAPDAERAALSWVPATRAADGTSVMVPAPLVDWPADDPAGLFDPSPSGAASGVSHTTALRSALMECVERDAFLVAWGRGLRLPAWRDLDAIASAPGEDRQMQSVAAAAWAKASARSFVPVVARVPTAIEGMWCVAAFLQCAGRERAVVGLKTSDRPWHAVAGALQEAWQVWEALEQAENELHMELAGSRPVITEEDRLAYMLTSRSYEVMTAWVESFVPGEPSSEPRRDLGVRELIEGMSSDGCDPLVVDLTFRLPQPVQRMGWRAVKAIPVGYQALRMDERHSWTWHAGRLDTAPARTGLGALYSTASTDRAHPLP
ncbi:YcaO-like family protein [Streptomyces sp. URMC 123]|uniref:YcaO-like family protein n=1 Tax=Streptomyces sp. URMC 123 TaxID=3423403 RepID=UPI003F1D4B14